MEIPSHLLSIVKLFQALEDKIKSPENNLKSNEVLEIIRVELEKLGFKVETGKKDNEKIKVPVLFGLNGSLLKYFEPDAYNKSTSTIIEVEAGRAVMNYQFLKDLFQACMMYNVDYLVTAIRNIYETRSSISKDFEKVIMFYDTLYSSNRLKLPLKGVLIIGY